MNDTLPRPIRRHKPYKAQAQHRFATTPPGVHVLVTRDTFSRDGAHELGQGRLVTFHALSAGDHNWAIVTVGGPHPFDVELPVAHLSDPATPEGHVAE